MCVCNFITLCVPERFANAFQSDSDIIPPSQITSAILVTTAVILIIIPAYHHVHVTVSSYLNKLHDWKARFDLSWEFWITLFTSASIIAPDLKLFYSNGNGNTVPGNKCSRGQKLTTLIHLRKESDMLTSDTCIVALIVTWWELSQLASFWLRRWYCTLLSRVCQVSIVLLDLRRWNVLLF